MPSRGLVYISCSEVPPSPSPLATRRIECLAQQGPPAPCASSWASIHAIPLVDAFGWVGEFCCPAHPGGGVRKSCPLSSPSYFPTAREASRVNQSHTCIKGGGVTGTGDHL